MRRRWSALVSLALVTPLAACGGEVSEPAQVDVSHVHWLDVLPDQERVLIATHGGSSPSPTMSSPRQETSAVTTGPAGEVWVATDEGLRRSSDAGRTSAEAVGW